MSNKVNEFYDEFIAHQEKIGINIRLYIIFDKLKKEGIKRKSSVLDIGCGIGFLTNLIASKVTKGKIVATDLSEKSIVYAKNRWAILKNVEWVAADIITFQYEEKFDFIILPDVIEHIPIEQHDELFAKLNTHSHSKTKVCINFPSANQIDWLEKNDPDKLQIIDQQIDIADLVAIAAKYAFKLKSLESYSIYSKNYHDYIWAVFEHSKKWTDFDEKDKWKIILRKALLRMKYLLNI